MSSPGTLIAPNSLIKKNAKVLSFFSDSKTFLLLHLIYQNENISVSQINELINQSNVDVKLEIGALEKAGLLNNIDGNLTLSNVAKKRILLNLLSLEFSENSLLEPDQSLDNSLKQKYRIIRKIGRGATSTTFLAKDEETHQLRTLKVFFPDLIDYQNLKKTTQQRSGIPQDAAIPTPIEIGEADFKFSDNKFYKVCCAILTYIDNAVTLGDFITSQDNLDSIFFEKFIDRIGSTLEQIEKVGLFHGDLHSGNILVVPGSNKTTVKDFWVIDFIGVPSSRSPELKTQSDMENFRNHLLRAAIAASKKYPGYAAKNLLGSKAFKILNGLRANLYSSFAEMMEDFYLKRQSIPTDYFTKPKAKPFDFLRVEWIDIPSMLIKLFEPVPSRFKTILRFGNAWISGPRGCGKSHYLRVLRFDPKIHSEKESNLELKEKYNSLELDFKAIFGVLFACRLGEFKCFTPEVFSRKTFKQNTKQFLKHVLILKIWNKTLETVHEGLEEISPESGNTILEYPSDFENLQRFLESKFGDISTIINLDKRGIFSQIRALCEAKENSAISDWDNPSQYIKWPILNENDLNNFFKVLKDTFPDLNNTRFYILVDDVSEGNVHFEMQKILNSLVRSAHSHHCFKITFEKFMYTLDTADKRSLDPGQDGTYVDLGEISVKSQKEMHMDQSSYMAKVINNRLKHGNYKYDIQTILGNSQDVNSFLSALSQPGSRRSKETMGIKKPKRSKALYAGWNIVWHLSHGSVRTLLELIENIFQSAAIKKNTKQISLEDQDSAVRTYSRRHFKALAMLPGDYYDEPLGEKLQVIISALGRMSKQYLQKYDTGEEGRWHESISLERLDKSGLSKEAKELLNELIKYGLLLVEGTTFSRAQYGLSQRYDLNKIFAPVFQITYRVRNHIYVSTKIFEEFLITPDVFLHRHLDKLNKLERLSKAPKQRKLF